MGPLLKGGDRGLKNAEDRGQNAKTTTQRRRKQKKEARRNNDTETHNCYYNCHVHGERRDALQNDGDRGLEMAEDMWGRGQDKDGTMQKTKGKTHREATAHNDKLRLQMTCY